MHSDIDRDLYEILEVERSATQTDIKRAFREKARKYHPDVASSDPMSEQKFKEATFAYEILSDPDKRRDYDTWGLEGLKRGAGVGFDGFSSFSDIIDMFFGDAFGGPFTRRRSGRRSVRGRDMETAVRITLQEVACGAERDVEVERLATCEECGGTGLMPGTHMSKCEVCGGSGQVTSQQRSIFGTFVRSSPCRTCGGTGEIITEPCRECGGKGRRKVEETLKVKIPPGVEKGDHIRIKGRGEGGLYGGESGDLYVLVDLEENPDFQREGRDLKTTVEISMYDAALGTELSVKTLDGDQNLRVPSGTQPGRVLKLKGKGLPPRGGGRRGDILVLVDVSIPTRLTSEEKKTLGRLRR